MAESKKNKRRQSQIFSDLTLKEEEEQSEELFNYYNNKNYKAPVPRKFETLFEGSKRGFSEDGEVALGKALSKRYIEDHAFWKMNKEKNSRRKRMVQKQYKGRKKGKVKPLTIVEEQKLKQLINVAPESDATAVESESRRSSLGDVLLRVSQAMTKLSRSNYSNSHNKQVLTKKPSESEDLASDKDEAEAGTRATSSRETCRSPGCVQTLSEGFTPLSKTKQIESETLSPGQGQPFSTANIKSGEMTGSCELELEGFEDVKDPKAREELLAALRSKDLLFCEPNPECEKVRKKNRQSVRMSVRRSARFLKDDSALSGSVFALRDVPLTSRTFIHHEGGLGFENNSSLQESPGSPITSVFVESCNKVLSEKHDDSGSTQVELKIQSKGTSPDVGSRATEMAQEPLRCLNSSRGLNLLLQKKQRINIDFKASGKENLDSFKKDVKKKKDLAKRKRRRGKTADKSGLNKVKNETKKANLVDIKKDFAESSTRLVSSQANDIVKQDTLQCTSESEQLLPIRSSICEPSEKLDSNVQNTEKCLTLPSQNKSDAKGSFTATTSNLEVSINNCQKSDLFLKSTCRDRAATSPRENYRDCLDLDESGEEVFISGIFGKSTLCPRSKKKNRKHAKSPKIN